MVLGIIVSAAVLALPDSSRLRPLSAELNYRLNINESVSTVVKLDGGGNIFVSDLNNDGFADEGRKADFRLSNIWNFDINPSLKASAGINATFAGNRGGQLDEAGELYPVGTDRNGVDFWATKLENTSGGAFVGAEYSVNSDNSLLFKFDVSGNRLGAEYGRRDYGLSSLSFDSDLHWALYGGTPNACGAGLRFSMDNVDETLWSDSPVLSVNNIESGISFLRAGAYVFSGYRFNDSISFYTEAELREDFGLGLSVVPQLSVDWTPSKWLHLDVYTRNELDRAVPMLQHFGAMLTSKIFLNSSSVMGHVLEDKFTTGLNMDIKLGKKTVLKLSANNKLWTEKSLVEYGNQTITFYTLSSAGNNSAASMPAIARENCFSARVDTRPFGWMGLMAWVEKNESKIPNPVGEIIDEPMRYLWRVGGGADFTFFGFNLDADATVFGPCVTWRFMEGTVGGKTPVWTLLNAKLSRDFGPVNIFVGGENLLGVANSPIISKYTFADFDASQIWSPAYGARVIAGIKVRIK